MGTGRALLDGPGRAAVTRRQDATIGSDRPTAARIIGSEGNRIKMIFRLRLNRIPALAGVARFQDQAARADRKHVLGIKHIQAVQVVDETGRLVVPTKTAVGRIKNHSIRAHRPAMKFVAGKSNRVDRVALRQRVLPFPTAVACLRSEQRADDRQRRPSPDRTAKSICAKVMTRFALAEK